MFQVKSKVNFKSSSTLKKTEGDEDLNVQKEQEDRLQSSSQKINGMNHVKRNLAKIKGSKIPKKLDQARRDYDDEFTQSIAPIGGIAFMPNYIQKGDGYECSLYIYDFPYEMQTLWGNQFKIRNSITYFQVEPVEAKQLKKDLERALNEYEDRAYDPQTPKLERQYAMEQYQKLAPLVSELHNDEKFFDLTIRIVLFEKTLESLEQRVREVSDALLEFGVSSTVLINEQSNDWIAPFRSLSKDKTYQRQSKQIPSLTWAGAFPFSFTSLNDRFGCPLGISEDGGQVIYDWFHKSSIRTSYNGCVYGGSGKGKSTFLNKLAKHQMIIGNKIRFIDPTGQSAHMFQAFGGESVSLDGSKGSKILNPLAPSCALEDSSVIEATLAKAETFMRIIAPDLTGNEIALFGILLKPLYEKLSTDPRFSDVLEVVEKELGERNLSTHKRTQLENLHTQLSRIIENYGGMFNSPSTLDTKGSRGVCFSMRELTQKDQTVFQAQMFNVLSYLLNELIENGEPQLKAFTHKELNPKDVVYYGVIFDEAHHIFNLDNPYGIKYGSIFMREARKYFGGMIYATHKLKDIVKSETESKSSDLDTLFEMTQYKFIFYENQNSLNLYRKVFDGELTEREISQIPNLKVGEMLLCISGDTTIKTKIECVEEEFALFGGGL
ncbi:VirB4 family type IV secretion system protein [Turicibacter bilis]|uniref:VirB4 family type IV secretion system protein n=1 Tax=Turicibacter bilis TaxID=2735723 RepID=UPI001BB01255|nr:hypothetical protein [Turicibacter bilis]MBS3198975.1 hypothetical protein [Turicibacter bilis]